MKQILPSPKGGNLFESAAAAERVKGQLMRAPGVTGREHQWEEWNYLNAVGVQAFMVLVVDYRLTKKAF